MNIRDQIAQTFTAVYEEHVGMPAPLMSLDTVLLETDLDSMGFAILVMELEDTLGFDPFVDSDEAYYPATYGEFVEFYVASDPRSR